MSPRGATWPSVLIAGLAAPFVLYITFIGLGSIPFFQRHFLYAHKINTLFWHDLDCPEYWAFARNQVTPFTLQTADGEKLYAWHVLPTSVYLKHEDALLKAAPGRSSAAESTAAFRLLKNDPDARVIVSFHGNAGHVAQGFRTDHYHSLTDTSNYHLLTIDYRGFGKSTGKPSETGLILDGVTLANWVMEVAGVPADRIVVMGQSLGTAVTSGVVEHFALQGVDFAGMILIAAFSNLPQLLTSYTAGGIVPVLSPIKNIQPVVRSIQKFIVDKWPSDDRIARIVENTSRRLRLTLIHAKNDAEIPYLQSNILFRSAAQAVLGKVLEDAEFETWKAGVTTVHDDGTFTAIATSSGQDQPDIIVREEIVRYGGHNHVMMSSTIPLAVMRSFEN
ncbi:Alpha/Beta hydrolase protein [Microdochium trichocladiopsis]|uniref:Alpha/Beta hydrolase protein n=1 Tax=Microdochium trichocladiopsis TaxID=1682393 RepID=A0A9P8XW21_9PEZI|nr:Alpha/Beta hydrolase protein [Microdochium trichocladiopsis]KAH7018381.1 Alpha/Beta hydrolase protein [Microdochium trichocladiopsis]